jgi:hypothetical protein
MYKVLLLGNAQKGACSPLRLWQIAKAPPLSVAVDEAPLPVEVEVAVESEAVVAVNDSGAASMVVATPLMVVRCGVTVEGEPLNEPLSMTLTHGFRTVSVTAPSQS